MALPDRNQIALLEVESDGQVADERFAVSGSYTNVLSTGVRSQDGAVLLFLSSSYKSSPGIAVYSLRAGELQYEGEVFSEESVWWLETGDVNNDGAPDLVFSTVSGVLRWIPLRADGSAGSPQLISEGHSLGLEVIDLDGDGNVDVVSASPEDSRIAIFWGDGGGAFTKLDIEVGSPSYGITSLPTPGLPSIAYSELGGGDRTMEIKQAYPRAFSKPRVLAKDFEIVTSLSWVEGEQGSFGFLVAGSMFSTRIRLERFANGVSQGSFYGQIRGGLDSSVGMDVNRDGVGDIVTVARNGSVSFLLSAGDGRLTGPSQVDVRQPVSQILTGDFDGDGLIDLILLRGDGLPPEFRTAKMQPGQLGAPLDGLEAGASFGTVGDFNDDCNLDIAVTRQGQSEISVYFGNGKGQFRHGYQLRDPIPLSRIVSADLDRDGHLDLVVARSNAAELVVFKGSGDGRFALDSRIEVESIPGEILAADFDGDGWIDLAVANFDGNNVSIFCNEIGSLRRCQDLKGGPGPLSIQAVNLGDGPRHLVVGNWYGESVTLHRSSGRGEWSSETTPVADSVRVVFGSDLDGDGIEEIFALQAQGRLDVFDVRPDGRLDIRETIRLGGPSLSAIAMDVDNNGRVDLFAGVQWYLHHVEARCGDPTGSQ